MNAREEIAYHLWMAVPSSDNDEAKARAEEMLDAHRAEVLAEAKVEVVAWLVKKAAEGTPIGDLASKVDRGAVRIFLGTGHCRDAMDAHRDKAATEALHAAADEIDRQVPDDERYVVKKTVVNILRRRANTVGEEATAAAATATPDFFQAGRTYTQNAPFRAPEDRPNFQCTAVAVHPTTGDRRAFGFDQPGVGAPWSSASMRDEEWADGWVDVIETEARRG